MFKDIKLYRDPRVLTILLLGFSSGLPFLLTVATLQIWLFEVGITKTVMGLFSLYTLPYALKFIWAPIVDSVPFPFLSTYFGHRKGWLLGSQGCLMASIFFLGSTNPATSIGLTALATFLVAFSSATQDIVYEAYRVEAIPSDLQGAAAGASSFGYRIGMLASGAGAIYLAAFYSWFIVYSIMALFVTIGILTVIISPSEDRHVDSIKGRIRWPKFKSYFKDAAISFLRSQPVIHIFAFILLFKAGDSMLTILLNVFLSEIGFSKTEIAHVAKAFGITFIMVGSFFGGLLLSRLSLKKVLILVSSLQILSCFLFMMQAWIGHSLPALFLTIGFENFSAGLGAAAFIYYLSRHCFLPFTGTHYAFLSSFASLSRIAWQSFAGWLADQMSWIYFYGLTALLCVPCLILLFFSKKHFLDSK